MVQRLAITVHTKTAKIHPFPNMLCLPNERNHGTFLSASQDCVWVINDTTSNYLTCELGLLDKIDYFLCFNKSFKF